MEYAILSIDREPMTKQLEKMGKTASYEDLTPSVKILKTDASVLDMKSAIAEINKVDTESCTAKIFEKDTRNAKKIWSFLNEGKKVNLVIMKDI